ncbi:uncharacterized protein LOC124455599 [Xenia sp. Carnegie-2017]|uniref:uncharacterized protein LOC124455599 n=1 Tax=Xenia sp. Carnegie-2017 TaxID=2897299 RepID=UPI001F04F611|nr:uncharacterized protein LOC124455599 [Xenia sp. Carnegie-2017]
MSLKLKREGEPMDLNEGNYNILAVETGDIQEPTLKKCKTDPRKTRANEEKVNVKKHEEFRENKLEIEKNQQQQPEDLPQRLEKANHDDNFHKLLDKSKNIKADVHKALQR